MSQQKNVIENATQEQQDFQLAHQLAKEEFANKKPKNAIQMDELEEEETKNNQDELDMDVVISFLTAEENEESEHQEVSKVSNKSSSSSSKKKILLRNDGEKIIQQEDNLLPNIEETDTSHLLVTQLQQKEDKKYAVELQKQINKENRSSKHKNTESSVLLIVSDDGKAFTYTSEKENDDLSSSSSDDSDVPSLKIKTNNTDSPIAKETQQLAIEAKGNFKTAHAKNNEKNTKKILRPADFWKKSTTTSSTQPENNNTMKKSFFGLGKKG